MEVHEPYFVAHPFARCFWYEPEHTAEGLTVPDAWRWSEISAVAYEARYEVLRDDKNTHLLLLGDKLNFKAYGGSLELVGKAFLTKADLDKYVAENRSWDHDFVGYVAREERKEHVFEYKKAA